MISIIGLLILLLISPILCDGLECSNPDVECYKTFRFGSSFPPINFEDPLSYPFMYLRDGMQVFVEWARNKKFCIKENGIERRFCFDDTAILEDDNSFMSIYQNYQDLLAMEDTFILTTFDGISEIAKSVTHPEGRLLIAIYSTNTSFYESSQSSFSLIPPFYVSISSIIPIYRIAGAKTVTLVKPDEKVIDPSNNDPLLTTTVCQGIEKQLKRSYFNVTEDILFYPYLTSDKSHHKETAKKIKELDSDLVIHCGADGEVLESIINEMKNIDYIPRGLMSGGTREYEFNPELSNFITFSSLLFSPDGGYPPGKYIKSSQEYDEIYSFIFPNRPIIEDIYKIGYASAIACEIVLNAIEKSQSFNEKDIIQYIRIETLNSFLAEIMFSSNNANLNEGIAIQLAKNKKNILSPAVVSNASIVYPMPTWEERIESKKYHPAEITMSVFLVLGMINSIAWAIFIIIFRKERKIAAASPLFLISMIIGSILIYISLFLWMPMHTNTSTCILFVPFLLIGFMLLFGSMVVKTWRVHLIFSQKTLDVFKVSNKQVAIFLSILVFVDIILFVLWVSLSTPTAEKVIVDEYRPKLNYYKCTSTTANKVLVWTMVGYHLLLFVYGAYLALRVRTIPIKIYDESKIIAFCIYNVGLVSIVVAIIEGTSVSSNRHIQYLIRTLLIFISTFTTINIMFIGKVRSTMRKTTSSAPSNSLNTSQYVMQSKSGDTSSIDTTSNDNSVIKKMKKENKELKKEIKDLREIIRKLKEKYDEVSSSSSSHSNDKD